MPDTKVTKNNLQEFAELFHAKNKTLYAEKAVEETIDGIQTDVAAIKQAYGTPLVAATAAAMTDHTKIYVYTGSETGYTSGNWYYWNGSAWTSGGVYNSTAFVTDATLTLAGKAADAKKVGDEISATKDALNELMETVFVDVTDDLTTVGNGYYSSPVESGLSSWIADSDTITYSLEVQAGETYKISGYNYYSAHLFFARSDSVSPYHTYHVFPDTVQTTQFYYEEYTIPYDGILYFATLVNKLSSFSVQKQEYVRKPFAMSEEVKSINAFNVADAVDGYYMNTNGTAYASNSNYYSYIPVIEGTYKFNVGKGIFGNNANKIPLFDANKTFLGTATATLAETGDNYRTLATLAITGTHINSGVKYIAVSGYVQFKNTNMVILGTSYPDNFIGYYEPYMAIDDGAENIQTLDSNPLFSKIALFDGDSICNGASALDGSSGWASRIGNKNSMGWRNASVGGATITYGISGVSHYLSSYIDTLHTSFPNAEYIIFEGGTNDADQIGSDTAKIGTIDMTDYSGSYDNTKFCGALDTLFYKALNYFPDAKIGFIIAPKMASSGVTPTHDYGENNNRYKFFTLIMQACKKWGIPYINLWDESQLNPSLQVMYDPSLSGQGNIDAGSMYIDGQHLTARGYKVITPKIEAWMKTL